MGLHWPSVDFTQLYTVAKKLKLYALGANSITSMTNAQLIYNLLLICCTTSCTTNPQQSTTNRINEVWALRNITRQITAKASKKTARTVLKFECLLVNAID